MNPRVDRRPVTPTEAELQRQVIQLARVTGWAVHHQRPAVDRSGRWSTPITGDAGYPDLTLARPGRLVFAELKSTRGQLRPGQQDWLELLGSVPSVEAYLWRPADWSEIERVLAR